MSKASTFLLGLTIGCTLGVLAALALIPRSTVQVHEAAIEPSDENPPNNDELDPAIQAKIKDVCANIADQMAELQNLGSHN